MSPRVLVVEDDPSLRRALQLNLTARGYQVDVAACANDALGLTALHPDLIVVDLGLPDMDGIDLIGRIRASSSAPILAASAGDAGSAAPAALTAGADDYLAKPFAADLLAGRVRAALGGRRPPGGGPVPEAPG